MTSTTATDGRRSYTGKCDRCGAGHARLWDQGEANGAWNRTTCACGRHIRLLPVVGKVSTKRACDEHCTTGTGRTCTCECAGRNHGAAWRVK